MNHSFIKLNYFTKTGLKAKHAIKGKYLSVNQKMKNDQVISKMEPNEVIFCSSRHFNGVII